MEILTIILAIVLIVTIILWLSAKGKSKTSINNLTKQYENLKNEKTSLESQMNELRLRNSELSKYQGVIDIEKKSKELIEEAEIKVSELKNQATQERQQANAEAIELKRKAQQDIDDLKKNAEILLSTATLDAQKIVENANKKAEEIAGDAIKALQNTKELEKTAKAMKNIIEGYGNQYLIPTYSLLDDLAEEFGHTEAGEKLKNARELSRFMIKNKTAAKCDYVEANRKETAINFVLDAFNGKVDSILSKVKKDNFGTLEQKIKDSFQVVNNNGSAFRNAAITSEFLSARIEELRWAVITQELKWEEQEEQRRIKEQIREEEKARREYEKAMKDAQKEEETLKKLIEKAQREVAQATEEQKAKYEEKLLELEGKLKIAEEKNQKAISMAQLTKSGNVYIISNIGSFGEDVYKIGMTRRLEPLDRIKELGDASVPFEFDVHAMIYSEDAPGLERELHKKFLRLQLNKVNPRKEFFKVLLNEIKQEVDQMGIATKWTLTADARQYRESLKIEEEISNNKQKQIEWERHQMMVDSISAEIDEEVEI